MGRVQTAQHQSISSHSTDRLNWIFIKTKLCNIYSRKPYFVFNQTSSVVYITDETRDSPRVLKLEQKNKKNFSHREYTQEGREER